ncbi:winged helix-turn-helix domain-containing protein [Halopiger goleimassiliensis]|uniref:winged helix-turn-helix domain-containing protein n=1 Tax=Halopiger goleimassiliensis TaxID=1293048 RepID=UPI000677FC21|nr:winged helix-turn-helix domain-containing protein [Halopiger goleimassiliensis]
MSNSRPATTATESGSKVPRAVIHKQILDRAAEEPDASMADIADDVSGATTGIVEHVLEEYGDPATGDGPDGEVSVPPLEDTPDSVNEHSTEPGSEPDEETLPNDTTESTMPSNDHDPTMSERSDRSETDHETPPDPDDVTEKQLETLRAIQAYPDATQADLGDRLGVSSATINQRVNGIDGFEWSDRHRFVAELFDGARFTTDGGPIETEDDPTTNVDDAAHERDADASDGDAASSVDRPSADERRTGIETPNPASPARADPHEELVEQLSTVTARLEDVAQHLPDEETARGNGTGLASDPELTHKVLHACLEADHISESEELEIVKAVTTGSTAGSD